MNEKKETASSSELAARCHEIQTGLGTTEVPEFDKLLVVGMGVRLALHIRGLPAIPFEVLKLVGYHFLGIPTLAIRQVVELLADVEFVKIGSQGQTIKTVLPNVPYYEDLCQTLGDYAVDAGLNEAEQLSVELVHRLSRSPEKLDALRNAIGAENTLFTRAFSIGKEGAYLRIVRARGRDIALTPTYFSENPDVFADAVAGGGAKQIQKILRGLRAAQGYPLALIEKQKRIGQVEFTNEEVRLLVRLAQDGALTPPPA